jgi:hypothetical protein
MILNARGASLGESSIGVAGLAIQTQFLALLSHTLCGQYSLEDIHGTPGRQKMGHPACSSAGDRRDPRDRRLAGTFLVHMFKAAIGIPYTVASILQKLYRKGRKGNEGNTS